jgi:hypothetical protein
MQTIINSEDIHTFFEENRVESGLSDNDFEGYLAHLEMDFYDWLRENLRSFQIKNVSK